MDKLRQKTDKELAKLEKKLDSVYRQAEKDIAEKWDAYMKKAAEKLEPLEKAYASAKASGDKEAIEQTGKALGQEKFRQTLQNARFKDMLDETTEKIADVNKIALSYINDEQPKVYSNNYNGTLKEVKNDIKGLNTGVKFNMVDERTVKELARKKDLLYSQKTLNRAKDKKWNLKALTSQVTQGILQGESVPDIAKRLAAVSDMNRTSCIRNARTMTTTSENSGRLAGLKEAEEKGIVYEKQWMATNDDRTRESHAELDGVSVPVDEPFPNGLMYPGDMSGDAEEVYNCRCSMVRNLIGFRSTDGDVVEVGDIERYERRTPAAAKTETPTEIAENVKIEKEFFTPLDDYTYENPFPEAAKANDAELTRFIFNEKEFANVSEKTIKDATTVEKLKLSQLKSTQGSIDAEEIKGMLDMSVKDLKELNEKEPPVVYKVNGEYIIADGNHRLSVLMAKGEETTMAKVIDVDKIKEAEKTINLNNLNDTMDEKHVEKYKSLIEKSEVKKLYAEYGGGVKYSTTKGVAHYSPNSKEVYYRLNKEEGASEYRTLAHENGHYFDDCLQRADFLSFKELDAINDAAEIGVIRPWASSSDEFMGALRHDMEELKKMLVPPEIKDENGNYLSNKTKLGQEILNTKENREASIAIQDAILGFYGEAEGKGTMFYGHDETYYNRNFNTIKAWGTEKEVRETLNKMGYQVKYQKDTRAIIRQYETACETWANVVSAITTGGSSLEMSEKYLPETTRACREIIKKS